MAANNDEAALLVRKAYELAWKGDLTGGNDVVAAGKKGDSLLLSLGYSQTLFAVAMGTGKSEDIEHARNCLGVTESIAEKLREDNQPEGVLSSMWKSLSIWDSSSSSSPSPSSGGASDARQRSWNFLTALLCLAEVNMNLLALYVKDRQWVSLGLSARRSWKRYEEAAEVHAQMKAAGYLDGNLTIEQQDCVSRLEFGVGLFHFLVSLVPPGLLMVVEAVGFQADREKGIRELQNCVDKKGVHSVTCALVLVGYHNFFMQQDEPANRLIDALVKDGFNTAPPVRLIAGTVARRQGNIARAIESYQLGISGVKNQPQIVLTLEAELGNTYFLNGDWKEASVLLDRFINNTTNRQYRCFSAWKLGVCTWMMGEAGRENKVAEMNQKVIELADNRFAYEKYSARIARRFLAQGNQYTKFEELWFHAWSWNQASRFQDSAEVLQKAVDVVKAQKGLPQPMVECVALCLYLKMSNNNGLEKLQEASENLQKLLKIQNEIVDELWVVPHAYVEMGELYLKRATGAEAAKMYNKASICFERAKSFSEYDFERPLSFRIARGQDLLRRVQSS